MPYKCSQYTVDYSVLDLFNHEHALFTLTVLIKYTKLLYLTSFMLITELLGEDQGGGFFVVVVVVVVVESPCNFYYLSLGFE